MAVIGACKIEFAIEISGASSSLLGSNGSSVDGPALDLFGVLELDSDVRPRLPFRPFRGVFFGVFWVGWCM